MKDNAKEFIIKNLRQSLIDKNQLATLGYNTDASHYKLLHSEDMMINFVKAFMLMGGNVDYCVTNEDFGKILNQWISKNGVHDIKCSSKGLCTYIQNLDLTTDSFSLISGTDVCRYGLVTCDSLIAWNGSILVSNESFEDSVINMPENCVLIAFSSQVVHDWKAYMKQNEENGKKLPDQILTLKPNTLTDTKIQLILIEDQNL